MKKQEWKKKKRGKISSKASKHSKNTKTAVQTVTKRKRQTLRFQTAGTAEGWKYITSIPLTRDRNAKLPLALLRLVPKEIKDIEGGVPLLSIMLNKRARAAVMFVRAVKYSDEIRNVGGAAEIVREIPKPLKYTE